MKSGLTHPLSQVVLTSMVLVAISIACSASRSAPSQQAAIETPSAAQASSPTTSNNTQEKQERCALTMSQAPLLKGLKLGMTPDEVLALFSGSKDDPEVRALLSRPPSRFGSAELSIRPDKYENKAQFKELSRITFTLLDSRISGFTLHYNGPEWSHVDKFVEGFVEGTNLPAIDQWQAQAGSEHQMKTLTCADFAIRVFAGGEGGNLNYVTMQDLEADKKLKERRKKAREQASPTPGQ